MTARLTGPALAALLIASAREQIMDAGTFGAVMVCMQHWCGRAEQAEYDGAISADELASATSTIRLIAQQRENNIIGNERAARRAAA